jgi:peptidoglycan/LPS O-acetylase OafA/YrhL
LLAALFFTDWREDLAGNVWTFPTMLWFDWTLGAVVAEGFLSGRRIFPRSVFLRVTAFVAVAASLFFKPTEALTFSLSSFAIALQVESYLWSESRERLIERLLVPLGLCSYSFYLLHYPFVGELLQEIPLARGWQEPWHAIAVLPVMFSVLFLASYVSYRVLERGSVYLGRVIWPSRGKNRLGSHAAP